MGVRRRSLGDDVNALPDPGFWAGRRVLVTGHTGFKGAWLTAWLTSLGAEVMGLSLPEPVSDPSLWELLALPAADLRGDIVDDAWVDVVQTFAPSVVLHLAAQPLVSVGYSEPLRTFATNVVGTGQVLDAVLDLGGLDAALVITTDKVYAPDQPLPHREDARLGGHDPYSASKAAAEHLVHSWPTRTPLATARAGNVIGGGDWAADRLLPDMARAWADGRPVVLRTVTGVRPWQHVLEPLRGYLLHAEALVRAADTAPRAVNFGPVEHQSVPVLDIVTFGSAHWARLDGGSAMPGWEVLDERPYVETGTLSLDSALARGTLGWESVLSWQEAVGMTLAWYHAASAGSDTADLVDRELTTYQQLVRERSA